MSEDNNNPPAFPNVANEGFHERDGMSLRDYFAAKVLPLLMQTPDQLVELGSDELIENSISATAEACYIYADAMLKERAKK